MSDDIILPQSKYINTNLGLKYLNGNPKLYLKVLNSFVTRYEDLKIETLNSDELKSTMHTLKGLASTLGMEKLSTLARELNSLKTEELVSEFSDTLRLILNDLTQGQSKTILILHDNIGEIDALVAGLESTYELMIALNINDALESLSEEEVDYLLLNKAIGNENLLKEVKEKNITAIYLSQPLKMPIITEQLKAL